MEAKIRMRIRGWATDWMTSRREEAAAGGKNHLVIVVFHYAFV